MNAKRLKRALDIAGSACLLGLLSPLFLSIAALIWAFDGRPLFHRRRVVSVCGEFDAFKFRTMRADADAVLQRNPEMRAEYSKNFKLRNDPRITRLGSILRKYSLDELPQLLNVLVGQMSLVGPRMITAAELKKYGDQQQLLLSVKPGLTGYWQVHGRQDVSYEERVRMDVEYIRTWTLAGDCRLLLLTPIRVIHGRGAY